MASGDLLVSLRMEMEETYKAVEDNDFQLELHTRKVQELEDIQSEIRHNCEIAQKYTEKDKRSLQQNLEEKEKEIMSLHAEQGEYERKIRKLEVKLATSDTKTKQKYKRKIENSWTGKGGAGGMYWSQTERSGQINQGCEQAGNKTWRCYKGAVICSGSAIDLKSSQIDEVQQELQLVQDQQDKVKNQLEMQENALEEAAMHSVGRHEAIDDTYSFSQGLGT